MKPRLHCLALLAFAPVLAAEEAALPPFRASIPELVRCRQLILVTAQDWNAKTANIRFFERATGDSPWYPALPASDAVIGRNGLGWGIGLHGGPPADSPAKREGDGRAPAGVFVLDEVFGYAPPTEAKITRFPYRQLTAAMAGVDDPQSQHYNRIVAGVAKDWRSAEVMLRPDDFYRWGVMVRHNWRPHPGYGSCTFLHVRAGPARGTAGCTTLPVTAVESLCRWLDSRKFPLLIQLPAVEYARWKTPWQLP